MKHKVSRREEMVTIRWNQRNGREKNNVKNEYNIQYNWYFEDINKIDITLDKLIRKEREEKRKRI